MDIVRTASVLPWTRSRPWARCFYISNLWCFCWTYHKLACIWTSVGDVDLKLYCFRYYIWTWYCNNYIWTPMYVEVLVNLCNMWLVCWIMYDLGCMLMVNRDPLWYLMDYWVYMGSSMTVWPLAGYHCTCALINWSVLLHSFIQVVHPSG